MYCPNCGAQVNGKFCVNCGTLVGGNSVVPAAQTAPTVQQSASAEEIVLWEGQPSSITGKIKSAAKVNPDTYVITNQRIIIKHGIIGKKEDEIELSRIKDYKVSQSIAERVQKIGDIVIISTDPSSPQFRLKNIFDPEYVKEVIRTAVMQYKKVMGVVQKDFI